MKSLIFHSAVKVGLFVTVCVCVQLYILLSKRVKLSGIVRFIDVYGSRYIDLVKCINFGMVCLIV